MSDFDVEVRVRIPVAQFKFIHQTAVENEVTVGRLVAELVRRGLAVDSRDVRPSSPRRSAAPGTPTPRKVTTPQILEALVRLNEKGWSDMRIGRELGMSNAWVALHRNRLNLPRNGKSGRRPRSTQPEGETN